MSILIKPTTLTGIKRLAKTIKQDQSIQHIRALDIAAKVVGKNKLYVLLTLNFVYL